MVENAALSSSRIPATPFCPFLSQFAGIFLIFSGLYGGFFFCFLFRCFWSLSFFELFFGLFFPYKITRKADGKMVFLG